MTDLIALGFPNRDRAEEARRRITELEAQGALELSGAAVAVRRDDGEIELIQPLRLTAAGAVAGAASGGLIGLMLLVPLLSAAVGAAAGAVGGTISAGILNAKFVRDLRQTLTPGHAALLLVIRTVIDGDKAIEELRSLTPEILRTSWTDEDERRLIAALAERPDNRPIP
ncbi:DUF1269 domain-containing protein [Kribbella sp. NPDC023972]|uniref:DUF1269 domain-containing protein n=1 Tax=Kribbella sp. NPDC023972 TaxID=3154795 RepID=UPI0034008628